MEDLKKELDTAFAILTAIRVSGNDVEFMASAKSHLRKAFDILKSSEKKDKKENA